MRHESASGSAEADESCPGIGGKADWGTPRRQPLSLTETIAWASVIGLVVKVALCLK